MELGESSRRAGLASGVAMISRLREWRPDFRRSPLIAAAAIFSILSAVYWLLLASDRYVSEADVIVQRTDLTTRAVPDLSSLLAGDTSGNRHDQLIMRDYLLSRDVAAKLDKELHLTDHFSAWTNDPLSRLAFANSPDDFYQYYKSRVTIEYDEYSGMTVIRAQAFSPKMAQEITRRLVALGEDFMNKSAQNLARGQVSYLEEQVGALSHRAIKARQDVVDYQNRLGIASPTEEAQAIGAVIAQLEAKKTELQIELATKSAFLVPGQPAIVELQQQIAAITAQIAKQNQRLAAPQGGRLNAKVEEIGRLQANAKFSEDLYRSSLAALEQLRFESTRTIKKLSVIQSPNLPHEAELPERMRETLIYTLLAFLLAGVAQLIVMIIKDHRD